MRPVPVMILALLSSTCGAQEANAPPGLFFPTYEPGGAVPTGIIEGSLEEKDGCLFVTSGSDRWLLLWPDGYSAMRADGAIEISNENDRVIGRTGGPIRLGGGEARPIEVGGVAAVDAWAEGLTGENAPEKCGHQYWLATGSA